MLTTKTPDNRVIPTTRWLAAFIVPFLAGAFALLYVFPERAAEWWAWA